MNKENVFVTVALVVLVLGLLVAYSGMATFIKMFECSNLEDRAILYFEHGDMDLYEEYCVKADDCNHSLLFRIWNFFGSKPFERLCT